MSFRCGIVGLPNVGKSTLFNALTDTAEAAAANYPFCTIEPNIGQVPVPDDRLENIAGIARSANVVGTLLTFVDIAGLVRGASKGEGLGNQFLSNIREVEAIIHVLRCFEDSDVTHVDGRVDPVADAQTVDTELLLADLERLERRTIAIKRKVKGGDKEAVALDRLIRRLEPVLAGGRAARTLSLNPAESELMPQLHLLTAKPVLYVCNVDEAAAASGNGFSEQVREMAAAQEAAMVVISAAIEAEVAQLDDPGERRLFLADLGLEETGLSQIIRAGYRLLDLITYFTASPKEARAWTVETGTKAPAAAGKIHTDFEKGFIRAETIAYNEYVACAGEQGARDAGRLRSEGRDYVVQDGDVILFRFNV